jgi:UDP-glucose 4-epimerase
MASAFPEIAGRHLVLTGASGFIGGHVLRRLVASGVRRIDTIDIRPLPEHVGPLIDVKFSFFHQRSILDPLDDVLAGADVVVHLAAEVSQSRSVGEPIPDATANVIGTLALLESMRHARARRLIYASSAAIYGTPTRLPVDETHPTVPDSPYGLSKLTGERYAHLYGRLHGFSVAALRFFNVYGPHQPLKGGYAGVITLFLDQHRRGVPFTIEGEGSHTRDFVHVDDVVRAVLLAASSTCVGPMNIGSGAAISIAELARLIGGPDWPVEHLPPRPGDIPHSVAATAAARDALGFEAEISLADGLKQLAGRLPSP